MKRLFLILILALMLIQGTASCYAFEFDSELFSYTLIDAKTGLVLVSMNPDLKIFPASTTKIMTATIALENSDVNKTVIASQKAIDAIGEGGMNIGIMAGEEIKLENLLQGLLISSANECANIIAETTLKTQEDFINAMNKKAIDLGATKTNFVNPSGMHDNNHFTTVHDLSVMAKNAMTIPKFRQIVGMIEYDFPPTNKHASWPTLYTIDGLLYSKSDFYEKATGVKTGYTSEAKHVQVASAINIDGNELICVTAGAQTKPKRNDFTKAILEWGFKNYSPQKIGSSKEIIKSGISVKDAKDNQVVDLLLSQDTVAFLPNNKESFVLQKEEFLNKNITAPVLVGEKLGYLVYKHNGVPIASVDLIASKNVELKPVEKVRNSIKSVFLDSKNVKLVLIIIALVVIIPIITVLLRIFLRKKRSKKI